MRTLLPVLACGLLAACADMSGLNAETHFACAAPEGSSCLSVSGVYANLEAGTTGRTGSGAAPGTRSGRRPADGEPFLSPGTVAAPYSGPPARSPERTLRVWVAPYEDEHGTLYDQKYFYVVVSGGQWLVDKNREAVLRNRFRQVYPLQVTQGGVQAKAAAPQLAPLATAGADIERGAAAASPITWPTE